MTRARLTASASCVLAVTGLTLGLALGLTRSAHAVSRVSPVRMVVFDCPGQPPQARPGQYTLTCADGNAVLAKLSWTSWTPRRATAAGILDLNDCTPYCAAGHFRAYPVLVIVSGGQLVAGHPGERCYTMMTQILTGPRPRYYDDATHTWVTAPKTQTSRLPTSPAAPAGPRRTAV